MDAMSNEKASTPQEVKTMDPVESMTGRDLTRIDKPIMLQSRSRPDTDHNDDS
jgi:hypothetical protein